MAAWLTYLKSRLLLPKEETTEEYTPEELEEALRYQLQRIEAMQNISKKLYARHFDWQRYILWRFNRRNKYKIQYYLTLRLCMIC